MSVRTLSFKCLRPLCINLEICASAFVKVLLPLNLVESFINRVTYQSYKQDNDSKNFSRVTSLAY